MKATIDGLQIEVPNGTSVIDAVFAAGRDVPYFCAHKYLSPIGACRMCLVEYGAPRKGKDGELEKDENGEVKIFWMPKPMASCTMMSTEGMHVKTARTSPVVAKSQAGMMEFTLLNHPLDCPTCDKGGACELQDRAFEYGYGASRYGFDRRHADKHYPLSDFIILDQERCIHCKRCVRYFSEIPGQEVLDFIERGGHTFIDTQEGGLPEGFQGNIADVCPVGALLDNVARFRGRNWEYDHTDTTCTLCSVGCAMTVDARNGRLERIVGRENREVNEIWLCDAGRFGHRFATEDRLTSPLVRENGALRPATWDEAIAAMRVGLAGQKGQLGLYINADSTLEEGVAAGALAQALGTASLDHWPRYPVQVESTATLTDVATADAVVVLGADLGEEAPVLELRIQEMLRGGLIPNEFTHGTAIADLRLVERPARKREKLAVIGNPSRLSEHAGIYAAANGHNALSRLLSPDTDELRDTAALLEKAEKPVLVIGADVLSQATGAGVAGLSDLASRTGAKVLAISPAANSNGMSLLNILPMAGGSEFGKLGEVGAAFISRLDPAMLGLSARAAGFTVVHDTHLTETAKQADVVLPAVTGYEKRGTVMNLEGRLLKLDAAPLRVGEAADLIRTLGALAQALDIKAPVRGLRTAQTMMKDLLGLDVNDLAPNGEIRGTVAHSAPSSLTHQPRLWKERMLNRPSGWVERIETLVEDHWDGGLPMYSGPVSGGND